MIKHHLKKQEKTTFYSKELRQAYRIAPATLKRHLYELTRYGYLKIISGSKSQGYEYELESADGYHKLQNKIENALDTAYQNIEKERLSSSLVAHQRK